MNPGNHSKKGDKKASFKGTCITNWGYVVLLKDPKVNLQVFRWLKPSILEGHFFGIARIAIGLGDF